VSLRDLVGDRYRRDIEAFGYSFEPWTSASSSTAEQEVTVEWATADGTAIAPDDYLAASGTAVIGQGETSAEVLVTIVDDEEPEDSESFDVVLSNAVGATLGAASVGTVTIEDKDVPEPDADANLILNDDVPANDDFADAIVIDPAGLPFEHQIFTGAATVETGEPEPCGSIGSTVWYAFTPDSDTLVTAHTSGSAFDTVLAVYAGSSGPWPSVIDCNDDGEADLTSILTVSLVAGTTYYFQAGGFGGDVGQLTFHLMAAATLTPCEEPPFSDVPTSHPFCAEIRWMKETGISTGFNDGTYRPSIAVTRQAMSAFMARLAGAGTPPACTEPPFSDVPTSHPFCAEIRWMKETGVSTGFNDGTYRPSIEVTRQAMSAFMARLAGADLDACTEPPFSDVPADHPFCADVLWMKGTGISTGFNDGTYRPAIAVTRQAMSAFMYRVSAFLHAAPAANFTGIPVSGEAPLTVSFSDTSAGAPDSWSWDFGDGTTSTDQHPTHTYTNPGTYDVSLTVAAGEDEDSVTRTAFVTVAPQSALPPDPADIAPQLDATAPSTFGDAFGFLYQGDNPIQRGVDPDSIDPTGVAVIRGRVLDRDGSPIPRVHVSIADHPEYGHTLSRADGEYDMAVTGGRWLIVSFDRQGLMPAQRGVDVAPLDFTVVDDVVLIAYAPEVDRIDLAGSTDIQVAQGAPVTDEDGTRTSTLLFEAGTQAVMVMEDGSEVPLDELHVRSTEYTVGDSGPAAMPELLPLTSGYTYAVELSVDEAVQAGAVDVRFDQPVISYVDNFLGFPVGGIVPAGYLDRELGSGLPRTTG
jgi:PKD repeat protein